MKKLIFGIVLFFNNLLFAGVSEIVQEELEKSIIESAIGIVSSICEIQIGMLMQIGIIGTLLIIIVELNETGKKSTGIGAGLLGVVLGRIFLPMITFWTGWVIIIGLASIGVLMIIKSSKGKRELETKTVNNTEKVSKRDLKQPEKNDPQSLVFNCTKCGNRAMIAGFCHNCGHDKEVEILEDLLLQ